MRRRLDFLKEIIPLLAKRWPWVDIKIMSIEKDHITLEIALDLPNLPVSKQRVRILRSRFNRIASTRRMTKAIQYVEQKIEMAIERCCRGVWRHSMNGITREDQVKGEGL